MPAHLNRNSIHHHNGPSHCNDLMRTQTGSNSGQHESIIGYYQPATRSHDRLGIPGWAPITEALAVARADVVLVEINYCCLGASVP